MAPARESIELQFHRQPSRRKALPYRLLQECLAGIPGEMEEDAILVMTIHHLVRSNSFTPIIK